MQYFSRGAEPPPRYFQSTQAESWRRQLLSYFDFARERQSQELMKRSELPFHDESINQGLSRLFNGKCAFCERHVETMPYRFRPEAEAAPLARSALPHLYYAWLAEAWENLLPLCGQCLPERVDFFPVTGSRCPIPSHDDISRFVKDQTGLWRNYPPKEAQHFLDPCVDRDLIKHLGVLRGGRLVPFTHRGAATIEHFRLNRDELVGERGREFDARLAMLANLQEHEPSRLFEFPVLEFGGSWHLLLRQLGRSLGAMMEQTAAARVERLYADLATRGGFGSRLERALERMDTAIRKKSKVKAARPIPRSGGARLKHISIRNYKALERVELDVGKAPATAPASDPSTTTAPSMLLIGENAAGKSSLLEAVALGLSDDAVTDGLGLSSRSLLLDPAMMGAAERGMIQPAHIQLAFDGGSIFVLAIDGQGLNHRNDEAADAPPVFAYGAFRQFQKKGKRYTPAMHVQSLFQNDYVLPNPEQWLLRLNTPRFDMVVRSLRAIFAIDGDFDVIERVDGRCYVKTRVPRTDGTFEIVRSPLNVVSSGFRTILAMVCDVMQGLMDKRVCKSFESLRSASAVVLVDEIEAHLHPRWKLQIMKGLRDALPNVTFIASTHDPLCIRGMNNGEVVVLRRVANDGSFDSALPTCIDADDKLPDVSQLTIEQMLTSDLFQLFSTDAPETERGLARIADLMARQSLTGEPLSDEEQAALTKFSSDIAEALPVGSTETQRIVQDAVADHLKQRRAASGQKLERLGEETKRRIVSALEKL